MSLQRRGLGGGQRKKMRLYVLLGALGLLAVAAVLVLRGLGDGMSFFYAPTDVVAKAIAPGQQFRLGGLVADDSVVRQDDGLTTNFTVTDTEADITVSYRGILPDLFREGQGVIAEGRLSEDGVFVAHSVLAKHDENYMPPEVADALKDKGVWVDGQFEATGEAPEEAPEDNSSEDSQ